MRRRVFFGLLALVISVNAKAADLAKIDAPSAGFIGDGKTDNTAAVQHALDALGHAGGGTLHLGSGNFLFRGHLNFPAGVCLAGTWQSVPSHTGIRDQGFRNQRTAAQRFWSPKGVVVKRGRRLFP
jgi:hypothetical protein